MKIIVSHSGKVTIGLEEGESKETIVQIIDELRSLGIEIQLTSEVEQHRHDIELVQRSADVRT